MENDFWTGRRLSTGEFSGYLPIFKERLAPFLEAHRTIVKLEMLRAQLMVGQRKLFRKIVRAGRDTLPDRIPEEVIG